jgi:ribosomal protein S18 acetylase RimI-like enzyme
MIKYSFLGGKYRPNKKDLETIGVLADQRHSGLPKVTEKHVVAMVKSSYTSVARDVKSGAIVGMAMLGVVARLEGKKGFIEDVVVEENFRGQGIGRKLMKMLIKKAKSLKVKELELTSNPLRLAANHLYQDMGFKIRQTNCYEMDLE